MPTAMRFKLHPAVLGHGNRFDGIDLTPLFEFCDVQPLVPGLIAPHFQATWKPDQFATAIQQLIADINVQSGDLFNLAVPRLCWLDGERALFHGWTADQMINYLAGARIACPNWKVGFYTIPWSFLLYESNINSWPDVIAFNDAMKPLLDRMEPGDAHLSDLYWKDVVPVGAYPWNFAEIRRAIRDSRCQSIIPFTTNFLYRQGRRPDVVSASNMVRTCREYQALGIREFALFSFLGTDPDTDTGTIKVFNQAIKDWARAMRPRIVRVSIPRTTPTTS